MYPYRRGNKKRSRSNGGGSGNGPNNPQPGRRGPPQQNGRRPASSAHELLPMLQPATKALAQVLAGNTRPSGQLAYARNILAHAEHLVDERQVERLNPAQREDFLEQLARLKLTLADADAAFGGQDDDEEQAPAKAPTVLDPERLREMALSLAVTSVPPPPRPPHQVEMMDEPPPAPTPDPALAAEPENTARGPRLRLKSTVLTSR